MKPVMRLNAIIFLQIFLSACCFAQNQQVEKSSKLPAFNIDTSRIGEGDFFTELQNYLRYEIGIKDSVWTSNGIEGESFRASTKFKLKKGHLYIIFSGWEDTRTVIEFKKTKKEEVLELVSNILIQIGQFSPELKILLSDQNPHFIRLYDDGECCYLYIKENNKGTQMGIGY